MILSFALTEKEFMAGIKTVSRRNWKPRTLRAWQRAWDNGRLVHDAANKVLFAGGRRIGKFKLTARPFRQRISAMGPEDLRREGGMCATVQDYCRLVGYRQTKILSVIEFVKCD